MISEDADRMTDFLVGASVAFGRSDDPHFHEKIGEAVTQLHDYIASLEAENAALKERTRWIPVSERLPEDGTEVLIAVESVFEPHYHIWKAYHIAEIPQWTTDNGLYYHRDNDYKGVTHWMPLPAAPKEDE